MNTALTFKIGAIKDTIGGSIEFVLSSPHWRRPDNLVKKSIGADIVVDLITIIAIYLI